MPNNPFVTSTALRTQQLFFGRQDEIRQLFAAVTATPPQSYAVVGLRRCGKSSLLRALARPDIQQQNAAELWTLFGDIIYPRLLTRDEARQLIQQPISEVGITLIATAADMVHELVGGHPFFLQVAGKELFDELNSGVAFDAAGQAQ